MDVFYFCSDLYTSVAAVSIVSLLENNKKMDHINIYIADDNIKQGTKERLLEMVSRYKASVFFVPLPDPSELLNFPFKSRYQIGHSYPRMCLAKLLPNSVDRVLVLDSDTLILGDLTRLWNTDLKGNILAGVVDCMNLKAYRKQFALSESQLYCNAGVFLVDVKKWRERKIEDIIIEAIKKNNGNVFFFEQTLMNYSCRGEVLKLPLKYNAYTLIYAFDYENFITWRKPTVFYSKNEVMNAKKNPVIIHFTRNFYMKSHPWKKGSVHPFTKVYRQYMSMTPWKNLWEDNRTPKQEFKYKLWHKIPQRILCQGANIIYNFVRPMMFWRNE